MRCPGSRAPKARGMLPSRRMRTPQLSRGSHQGLLRDLQHGDGVLATDTGKLVQELIEWMSGFEVVDERADWDTRAGEDGSAAESVGGCGDCGIGNGRHGGSRCSQYTETAEGGERGTARSLRSL